MMNEPTSAPLALRPRDAAKALGISPRHLWGLTVPRGPIPAIRIGTGRRKITLYSVDELKAWLARQTQAAKGANDE